MRSTSKLELAIDKNVFYVAGGLANVAEKQEFAAQEAVIKILRICHTTVASLSYLIDIKKKLRSYKNKTKAQYLSYLIDQIMRTEGKVKYIPESDIGHLQNIPEDDQDIAWFATHSRDKILLVADIGGRPADKKFVDAIKNYDVEVLTTSEFLDKYRSIK